MRRTFGLAAAITLLATACGTSTNATPTPAAQTPAPATATAAAPTQAPATQKPATAPPASEVPASAGASGSPGGLTTVRLQLQWVTQSQFAGYFAAVDQGFYTNEGLNVQILQGAVDIVPQTVVASGGAEFGIAWLPKVLASIEQGADLVNIAQPFQRSGTLEISWKDSNITKPADWRGKKVGTWGFGNELELYAAMRKVGIDPTNPNDVTIVAQDFTMNSLFQRDLDAAEAMIYNEYAQVLEATNPTTGQLYQPSDLNVISMESAGTSMLQDGIFAQGAWLAQPGNADIATRFIRASDEGWMWCRDNFDACVQVVLNNGPTLGKGHQAWQLNEINALIWPSPAGIGMMNGDAWAQTVRVAREGGVITTDPPQGAYRTDLALAARQPIVGDAFGNNFVKQTIQVTAGGN